MTRLGYGLALAVVAIAGCGGSSDAPVVAAVSGVVTVKGQPRADLNVTFHPEDGGRPATGLTGPDGKFTLTTNNTGDGAIVGRHKVTITGGTAANKFGDAGPPMPGQPGFEQWQKEERDKIDSKYADPEKSGLLYTVPAEGLPNLEIKIP